MVTRAFAADSGHDDQGRGSPRLASPWTGGRACSALTGAPPRYTIGGHARFPPPIPSGAAAALPLRAASPPGQPTPAAGAHACATSRQTTAPRRSIWRLAVRCGGPLLLHGVFRVCLLVPLSASRRPLSFSLSRPRSPGRRRRGAASFCWLSGISSDQRGKKAPFRP